MGDTPGQGAYGFHFLGMSKLSFQSFPIAYVPDHSVGSEKIFRAVIYILVIKAGGLQLNSQVLNFARFIFSAPLRGHKPQFDTGGRSLPRSPLIEKIFGFFFIIFVNNRVIVFGDQFFSIDA